jgi:hypothetical protein
MSALFRLLSFASGVALNAALVYFIGYLAAIPTPKGYFESFAKPHWHLAFSAFTFVTVNIPVFLLCAIWCGLTVRNLGRSQQATVWWCIAGLALGMLYFLVQDDVLWILSKPRACFDILTPFAGAWSGAWLARRMSFGDLRKAPA